MLRSLQAVVSRTVYAQRAHVSRLGHAVDVEDIDVKVRGDLLSSWTRRTPPLRRCRSVRAAGTEHGRAGRQILRKWRRHEGGQRSSLQ